MNLFSNPEFIRNARGQLRVGKVLSTLVICAAISVATGVLLWSRGDSPSGANGWGIVLLKITIFSQVLVLAGGGGIACLNAIHKEKEQNTFDFQRVTRLTPLELTLGKLFGAPILSYLIVLCFVPLAIFGAWMGRAKFSLMVTAYVVAIAGSIVLHALALVASLLTVKGSHSGAILLLVVLLLGGANQGASTGFFRLGPLSPFFAATVVEGGSSVGHPVEMGEVYEGHDYLFGLRLNHVAVLLGLNLIFSCWFLLAVVRNIKRDPDYYELYSPLESLVLATFVNLLLVGFFNWHRTNSVDAEAELLGLNVAIFFCLGLGLLRNRAAMRRILRSEEASATKWWSFVWPAPLLIFGVLVAAGMIVAATARHRNVEIDWSVGFAWFRALFFMAWLVRDIQYLQWMSLRRGKHPVIVAVLYQLIFYVCVSALLTSMGVFRDPSLEPFAAFFLPTPIGVLDHSAWAMRPAVWTAAFAAQWGMAVVFLYLQQRLMKELQPGAAPSLAAEATS